MAEKRRSNRTQDNAAADDRAQHDQSTGPAPYDQAKPGTPKDRVITKGERERPGPTSDELEAMREGQDVPTNNDMTANDGSPLDVQNPYAGDDIRSDVRARDQIDEEADERDEDDLEDEGRALGE